MLKKLGIVVVIAMLGAACGSDPAQDAGAADTTPVTAEAADDHHADDDHAHEGDEPADHHDDDTTADADHPHEGDEPADHHDDDGNRIVEVTVTEFEFDVPDFTVTRGETVAFVVTNGGRVDHEFRITTEHTVEEHLEEHGGDHEAHAAADEGHHEEHVILLAPGETGTLTVPFHADAEFDVATCLLQGHWEAGLHAPLTIEG